MMFQISFPEKLQISEPVQCQIVGMLDEFSSLCEAYWMRGCDCWVLGLHFFDAVSVRKVADLIKKHFSPVLDCS